MPVSRDILVGMQSNLQSMLEVETNNAANMTTHGFQEDVAVFAEFVGNKDSLESHSYVTPVGTTFNIAQGAIEKTGNTFHVAIQGAGYYKFQTPEGDRYGRQGAFLVDVNGQLTDAHGNPVLSADGGTIEIPLEAKKVSIGGDGIISSENGIIGRLGVFTFENQNEPRKTKNTFLETTQTGQLNEAARFVQGSLEQSNVNPIKNTARLIEINRQFSMNQKQIEADLKREEHQIQTLVKLPPAA